MQIGIIIIKIAHISTMAPPEEIKKLEYYCSISNFLGKVLLSVKSNLVPIKFK